VPLTLHVIGQGFVGDERASQYRFWSTLNKNVPEIIFKYSENRPSIVFCHSKPDAESLADLLATVSGIAAKGNANQDIASQTRVVKLQRVLYAGIAFHHAGLEIDDRALVQKAFTEGRIRVLCATSTIAMGVNYPARLVVIKGTKAWRGGQGYQDLDHASLVRHPTLCAMDEHSLILLSFVHFL
jgi:ATP-dependent DNA helicase HFM1/MER3